MQKINLKENLNIKGLEFIGSDYGMDLYKINSFDAGMQLKNAYPEHEDDVFLFALVEEEQKDTLDTIKARFNTYFSEGKQYSIYAFTDSGTNKVRLFAMNAPVNRKTNLITFNPPNQRFTVKFNNYILDETNYGSNYNEMRLHYAKCYPLYLLPNLNLDINSPFIVNSLNQHSIVAFYPSLFGEISSEINFPNDNSLTAIESNVLKTVINTYPNKRFIINIPKNIKSIESNAFDGFKGLIQLSIKKENLDSICKPNWTTCKNIVFSDDKIEKSDYARVLRTLDREEQTANADIIDVLRFKETSNGIDILGIKRGKSDLNIPNEINGKPVIRISPFAFYGDTNLENVELPDTIKEIGKGAFYNCPNLKKLKYPKDATIYRDAIPDEFKNN